MTRERSTAMKKRPKRVSIKKDGNLINQISLDILMDNNSDSAAHRESVRNLLVLAGVSDCVQLGDSRQD